MNFATRERATICALMLIACFVFAAGINWGLPDHRVDPFLFGGRDAWTGEQIAGFAGEHPREKNLAADVDANPVHRIDQPILLNKSLADRAQIIRRYRLFTYQPDEMITLMSLSQMNATQLDPRLYQYGGLWIYPIGAALKVSATLGLVKLTPSIEFYLDHPEMFRKFYFIARTYSVFWGVVGAWAMFQILRVSGADLISASIGALIYICLPVVINQAHEAKPHLAGAVLTMLAAVASARFNQRWNVRWLFLSGALAGAAAGMVLSAYGAFTIPMTALFFWKVKWRRRFAILALALAAGALVYAITNPFVIVHIFADSSVLISNFENSRMMYHAGGVIGGLFNAARLIGEGAGLLTAAVGLVGLFVIWSKHREQNVQAILFLSAAACVSLIPFIAFAVEKPGEYGRFAILFDITLAAAAIGWIGIAKISQYGKVAALCAMLAIAILPATNYLRGFIADASSSTSRLRKARALTWLGVKGASTLGVFDEPAPYNLPPIDLFGWTLYLLPKDFTFDAASVDVIVRPVDRLENRGRNGAYVRLYLPERSPTIISWADKPMEIWVRADLMNARSPDSVFQ